MFIAGIKIIKEKKNNNNNTNPYLISELLAQLYGKSEKCQSIIEPRDYALSLKIVNVLISITNNKELIPKVPPPAFGWGVFYIQTKNRIISP